MGSYPVFFPLVIMVCLSHDNSQYHQSHQHLKQKVATCVPMYHYILHDSVSDEQQADVVIIYYTAKKCYGYAEHLTIDGSTSYFAQA